MPAPFIELEVGERVVKLTNPDKILFPKARKSKISRNGSALQVADGNPAGCAFPTTHPRNGGVSSLVRAARALAAIVVQDQHVSRAVRLAGGFQDRDVRAESGRRAAVADEDDGLSATVGRRVRTDDRSPTEIPARKAEPRWRWCASSRC